jgi:hypothetical protein
MPENVNWGSGISLNTTIVPLTPPPSKLPFVMALSIAI